MKKNLLLIVAFCYAIAANAQNKYDVNGDGNVDIMDINAVISYICGDVQKEAEKPHEYVNLSLPSGTMWATCNVGANNPEDYGLYFSWGETTGYTSNISDGKTFDWAHYKWSSVSPWVINKYCTSTNYGTVDNLTVLETSDDVATVSWGSEWCMPTYDQIRELVNKENTDTTWTTRNGVKGLLIKSRRNLRTIFLPAAGERIYSNYSVSGSYGFYWTRSLSDYSDSAYSLYFGSDYVGWNNDYRYYGLSVRPVRVK